MNVEARTAVKKTRDMPAPAADPRDFQGEAQESDAIEALCAAMIKTGIDPAFIHAFRKTGCLLTDQNIHFFTEPELAKWNEAINEYPLINTTIQ